MVDTVRTLASLQTIFADGQAANSITEQDLRDFLVSSIGTTGWADYVDTANSTGSPQSCTTDSDTILTNNGGTSQTQELPLDCLVDGLYDTSNNTIVGRPGDGILVTVEFTIRRASGSGSYSFTTGIDIGIPGVLLYDRFRTLAGAGEQNITFSTGAYTLDTWQTNGGELILRNPTVNVEVYNKRVIVYRLHKGRGTYPPA